MRICELTPRDRGCEGCESAVASMQAKQRPGAAREKAFAHRHLVNIHCIGIVLCRSGTRKTLGAFGGALGKQVFEMGVSGGISFRCGHH